MDRRDHRSTTDTISHSWSKFATCSPNTVRFGTAPGNGFEIMVARETLGDPQVVWTVPSGAQAVRNRR